MKVDTNERKYEPNDIKVNDNVKLFRIKSNLTQDDVAKAIGVSRSTYASKENQQLFDRKTLEKLADFYQVQIDVFTLNDKVRPETKVLLKDNPPPLYKEVKEEFFTNSEKVRMLKLRDLTDEQRNIVDDLINHFFEK